jgi:hypothetical protein
MIADIVTKDFFNPKKVQKDMRWENTITWIVHQFMKEGSHSNMKFLETLTKNVVFSLLF